ncbi:MAG: hypothetical protein ACI9GY_000969 [Brevundimonas sp.]|jgi:hypothetical protein|tara:strand:- start:4070 stop:4318 length:249 start_codon:yes stop_codon:yes gene_type:complete
MKNLPSFLVTLLFLAISNLAFAGIYDDWPDEAICTWLEQKPDNEEFLAENEKRELNCFKREDFSPRKDPIKEEYKSNEGSSY